MWQFVRVKLATTMDIESTRHQHEKIGVRAVRLWVAQLSFKSAHIDPYWRFKLPLEARPHIRLRCSSRRLLLGLHRLGKHSSQPHNPIQP